MLSLSLVQEIDRPLQEGKLSQRKIAARLGVSRGTDGAISNGRRGIHGKETLVDASGPLVAQGPPECGVLRLHRLYAVPDLPGTRLPGATGRSKRTMPRTPPGLRRTAATRDRLAHRRASGGWPRRLPKLGLSAAVRPPRLPAATAPESRSARLTERTLPERSMGGTERPTQFDLFLSSRFFITGSFLGPRSASFAPRSGCG